MKYIFFRTYLSAYLGLFSKEPKMILKLNIVFYCVEEFLIITDFVLKIDSNIFWLKHWF